MKSKAENKLKFKQYGMRAQSVHTIVKPRIICCESVCIFTRHITTSLQFSRSQCIHVGDCGCDDGVL